MMKKMTLLKSYKHKVLQDKGVLELVNHRNLQKATVLIEGSWYE